MHFAYLSTRPQVTPLPKQHFLFFLDKPPRIPGCFGSKVPNLEAHQRHNSTHNSPLNHPKGHKQIRTNYYPSPLSDGYVLYLKVTIPYI